MMNKVIIVLSFLYLVIFSGSLHSQCSCELLNVKQKKRKIMLVLQNTSNDTMRISSHPISYHKDVVFEPLYYTIKEDTLSIVFVRKPEVSFGHEFQGEVLIDGKRRVNYPCIDPGGKFILMISKSKKQRVTNILVLFENCILEENIEPTLQKTKFRMRH